jgi:hypothetical protein
MRMRLAACKEKIQHAQHAAFLQLLRCSPSPPLLSQNQIARAHPVLGVEARVDDAVHVLFRLRAEGW